jgi:hypothetical protein
LDHPGWWWSLPCRTPGRDVGQTAALYGDLGDFDVIDDPRSKEYRDDAQCSGMSFTPCLQHWSLVVPLARATDITQ